MAWTAPRTWVPGELVTASMMNTHVRDNLLDLRQSGSWQPVIAGSTSTSGQTYGTQIGSYWKDGPLAHVQFYAALTNKGTITGVTVKLSGLPFPVLATSGHYWVGAVQWGGLNTNWVNIICVANVGTSDALIRGCTAAAATNATDLVPSDITNTTGLIGTLIYEATS